MKARKSEMTAADGRRIVVRWGTGYAPSVSEYTLDSRDGKWAHTREWNVSAGLAAARRLAKRVMSDEVARG